MNKLTSILVVASRYQTDRALLDKAVLLARRVGAQINLFSCDAALARVLRRSSDSGEAEKAWDICLAEHLAYLRALKAEIDAPDVQINVDAACYSPLYEGVLHKAEEVCPDLIMKSPSGEHPMRRFAFDSSDYHLMRGCSTTLMLTRSRPWRSAPRFAALVNVSDESSGELASTTVHAAEYFSLGCRGELDLIYSEASQSVAERSSHASTLEQLAQEYRIDAKHVHVLKGLPETTLSEYAGQQQYDALVMGGLTHRRGLGALVGSLTSKLVDTIESDFILVKRVAPLRPMTGEPREKARVAQSPASHHEASPSSHGSGGLESSVLWQSVFGD
jgi:nucleotide-binding universal stress UspA family protein